ncbi:hypothetical protein GOV11_00960 [Candidatus Woesearchaeota archaeon]|nr:hypothetical protein [Candidatus Woesearchaeota archaeon]
MKRGWFNDSWRHSLSAKGIKTGYFAKKSVGSSIFEKQMGDIREMNILLGEKEDIDRELNKLGGEVNVKRKVTGFKKFADEQIKLVPKDMSDEAKDIRKAKEFVDIRNYGTGEKVGEGDILRDLERLSMKDQIETIKMDELSRRERRREREKEK